MCANFCPRLGKAAGVLRLAVSIRPWCADCMACCEWCLCRRQGLQQVSFPARLVILHLLLH